VATPSTAQLAEALAATAARLARSARTEEELKIGFEKALAPALAAIGVSSEPRYERLAGTRSLYRGRPDAVHGQVIVEYEAPGAFQSERMVAHAREQLVAYMGAEAAENKLDAHGLRRIVGVGFDGQAIFFLRYRGQTTRQVKPEAFAQQGPYPFTPDAARTFLTYLRSLARQPLTAESLAERFGPKGRVAPLAVSAFVDALTNWADARVGVFLDEWKRLFGIIYGEHLQGQREKEAAALRKLYSAPPQTPFQELLFAVHSYFALLMKLITAELVAMREEPFGSSLSDRLTHMANEELTRHLADIEAGGVFARRGITNFLEGDFFRWYLDAFSPRVEEAVREMARALSNLEAATTTVAPEHARDLLKRLYQYLVPQDVRHKLGEYYTPDWLAELMLNEVGYDGNTLTRLLDPACGSGTFLVLAIERAGQWGAAHGEPRLETAKRILANIWGFDLNPLAVIAARANYLFALGDMADLLPALELPIYLADSVLWPEMSDQMTLNFAGGEHVKVSTSIGEFHVPAIWIRNKGFLMARAAPLVEEMAKQAYEVSEALGRLKAEGLAFPPHEKVIANFYQEVALLEKEGKNGIWARFLKNAFAPMVAGTFDLVVGNPPWVRWGYLSDEYRQATLGMWKRYGLFSLKGHAARLGAGEKDFSMLFTYAAADHYLEKGGKLAFLITQEVFKSKGAGEGFRRFQLGQGEPIKVLRAHDLVQVQPFEAATNKSAAIVLKKGQKTRYPVPYFLWTRKKGVGSVPTNLRLDEARKLLKRTRLLAQPVGGPSGPWQTITKAQRWLTRLHGKNAYRARRGASTEPYGVFWLELVDVLANGDLLVRNMPRKGKREVPQVEERIEPDLVFPALRGADIQRWKATPRILILMTQDPQKREPFAESQMKARWPRTYTYLTRFKDILLSRGSKVVRQFAERTAFYAMYGIGPYTVARYKVVWKRMASDIFAAVVSQHKTPFGYKTVVPTDTTSLFATDSETEAHYLCAIANSAPVREFIRSYSSAGRGFGAPSVMNHLAIPKFDPKDKVHRALARTSKSLHTHAAKGNAKRIETLERQNDELVTALFTTSAQTTDDR